ncbi:MAG: biotin--[acetyl-CoA-carboxylase] ligase [Lachnospiraceae bacterium]|nr:biotin--[acetyl-CoA-carboxylase] ligase [Lachnospiraceae bacterium]
MTKDSVLAFLMETDGYVSGEMMSRQLGLSRMAVSAAVKALREDGYVIDSVTRKGYRLLNAPDRLTNVAIGAYLTPERMASVICYDVTDSTNKRIRDMADDGAPAGTVAIANEQTAGRGRRGRSFLSLKDKGIYLSMLLRPACTPADIATVTAWTAVAIGRAIFKVTGVCPGIKWVNDLIMDHRKICGILTEMSIESETGSISHVVIGIGVNVNQTPEDFPEELREVAGSVAMAVGHPVSRAALAAEMVRQLDILRERWPEGRDEFLEEYQRLCLTVDQDIRVISGQTERLGHAVGIDENFALLVTFEDGHTEAVESGEVSVRGIDGYS